MAPSADVAVHVVPALLFFDEAAQLMQARGAAGLAQAGDEFDGGVGVVLLLTGLDLQAQPFDVGGVGFEFDGRVSGCQVCSR